MTYSTLCFAGLFGTILRPAKFKSIKIASFYKKNQQRDQVAYKIIKHISNKHVQTGSNRIKMDHNGSK